MEGWANHVYICILYMCVHCPCAVHYNIQTKPQSTHTGLYVGFLRRIGLEDILYKPVQPGIKGRTEVQFYESLFSSGELPGEVVSLRDLIPGYYGRHTIQDRAGHFRILST